MATDGSGLNDDARAELNPEARAGLFYVSLADDVRRWLDEQPSRGAIIEAALREDLDDNPEMVGVDDLAPFGTTQPDPIPDRPADGAKAEKWAAYVVALGLHPDEAGNYSRSELIDLADRLGG